MILPAQQIVLFREILEGFKLRTEVSDKVLAEIYTYLFTPAETLLIYPIRELHNTVEALKSIVETQQLTSLESIVRFFDAESREIDSWMEELIEETERAKAEADKASEELDEYTGIAVPAVAVRPALSRYYVCSDDHGPQVFVETYMKYKEDLLEYVCLQMQNDLLEDLATAEDIVQDTLLDVWSVLQRPGTWTMGEIKSLFWLTARQLCLDACARKQREPTIYTTRFPNEPVETFDIVLTFEIRDQFSHLAKTLDARSLKLYKLRTAGYSLWSIAKELGISFGAAAKELSKLLRWVEEHSGDIE